jgi:hypothetical protein
MLIGRNLPLFTNVHCRGTCQARSITTARKQENMNLNFELKSYTPK